MFKHFRASKLAILSVALLMAAMVSVLPGAVREAGAQIRLATCNLCFPLPTLTAAVISPASGSAQPTQTIQLGVFGLTNNSATDPVAVNSVTLKFSNPGLFSSTTLTAVGASPSTAAPPPAINVYNFVVPPVIQPGQELAFALTVTLADTSSRNETGGVAYASVGFGTGLSGEGNPLWIALGAVGLAMLALPGGTRRRMWLAAALILLLASGAPGCGGTGGGGGDPPTGSSAQSVTAVSAFALTSGGIDGPPVTTVTGLPLDLGSITRN
ncbi:MAG TPA: hypothetical protein VNE82_21195 [Candidatus Binataceae bacterium]|nr:hypothetical protein [Candidatus Binataceae bacterium]